MTQNTIIDVIKVALLQLIALGIALSDVKEVLSIISICIAIGYGIWKWRQDIKNKKSKKDSLK